MWLTHYTVATPAGELVHDLAVSTRPDQLPSARWAGFTTNGSFDPAAGPSEGNDWWFAVAGLAAIVGAGMLAVRRRGTRGHAS
jgi:LPXTG-motif cell wall-anchored protein